MNIFLYGPPGSGKSTLCSALAKKLDLPCYDLDLAIQAQAGKSIPEIFEQEGEAGFRERELKMLFETSQMSEAVIGLGGGALLNPQARQFAEAHGQILVLDAPLGVLTRRLDQQRREHGRTARRPLLAGKDKGDELDGLQARLGELLARRQAHYASFGLRLDSSETDIDALCWKAQVALGRYRVTGMGKPYDIKVMEGGAALIGHEMRKLKCKGMVALVSDENVTLRYSPQVLASLQDAEYSAHLLALPAGESHKTIETVLRLWQFFLESGLERGSTVVALGGGVVGDLAGFAAATYLRGIDWVVAPTTLLSMVDASMGGKTGADLPQGKNLIGAFHPPVLVLADPLTLATLPEDEICSGMGEVVKHGVIGDPELFELCGRGMEAVKADWGQLVRRAMAVKVQVIQDDPYEKGRRAALNLGHTIGHAIEKVSGFTIRHGEAVAIGMIISAKISERMRIAEPGLSEALVATLSGLGLATRIPPKLNLGEMLNAIQVDKKRSAGKIRFVLPVTIGEVRHGLEVDEQVMKEELCNLY